MNPRYYGKIFKNKDVSFLKFIALGTIYGIAGCGVGYLIPFVMDENLLECHKISVLMFGGLGVVVGVIHSMLDIPNNKSNMIIVAVFFAGYFLLRYLLCQ